MACPSPISPRFPIARALEAARSIKLTGREANHRRTHRARNRANAWRFLNNVGLGYLSLGPLCRHTLRRRRPAHPPGHADRFQAARRALRSRRAFHRPAPPRQRTPARSARKRCATWATPCSSSSMMRKPSAAPTTSSTSAPAPDVTAANWSPPERPPKSWTRPLTHRAYISGRTADRHAARAPQPEWQSHHRSRRAREQPQEHRRRFSRSA